MNGSSSGGSRTRQGSALRWRLPAAATGVLGSALAIVAWWYLSTPASMASRAAWQHWVVLVGGLLVSGLLAAYLHSTICRAARVEQLVHLRTAELSKTNRELERQINERIAGEQALTKAHNELERRVEQRTALLARANAGLLDEIIEHERTEQALRLSQQELADLFDNAPIGLHLIGPDGFILRANKAQLSLLGYDTEDYVRHHIGEFHVDREVIDEILSRLAKGETLEHFEARIRCKHGAIKHVLIDANVLRRDGRLIHSRCFVRDITQRQQAEVELRQSEALKAAILNAALDAVITIDHRGTIVEWNPSAEKIFGYSRAQAIGSSMADLIIPPQLRDAHGKGLQRYLALGEGPILDKRMELPAIGADHREFPVELSITRINIDGPPMFTGFARDITDRTRAESELSQLNTLLADKNAKLQAMAERAHRFVDDVSHEFRTPLTVIKEFASIIADGLAGPVSAAQAEYLEIVDGAVLDLNQMVEDFLDSSKLKAGCLRVDRRRHEVAHIIEVLRPTIDRKAAGRKIRVRCELEPDLPPVFADEEKIRRVIMNLLTNAVKFSPEGRQVTLWARRADDGDVEIGVTDQGPGLSPEDLQLIFERFKQVETARSPSIKGFGLGLNIAQELVWLNLGRINVSSEKGQGATFWFTLPADDPALIVRRLFDRLAEHEQPQAQVAILSARSMFSHDSVEEIRNFLAGTTWATDVMLPAADNQSLIIIGRTTQPQGWIDRLRTAAQGAAQETRASMTDTIRIDLIGVWAYPDQRDEAVDRALLEISGVPSCA